MAEARAFGAISVVNAIITGHAGASAAIDLATRAKVTLMEDVPEVEVIIDGKEAGGEGQLARLCLKAVVSRLGKPEWGGRVETTSDVPTARGLKSSSAAANAVVLATNLAFQRFEGTGLPRSELLDAAVEAALDANVTITGAFDDASASMTGGLCITNNRERKLIQRIELDDDLRVILVVPPAPRETASVRDLPYDKFAPLAEQAHVLARQGRWQNALTLNGLACAALYDCPASWTLRALDVGAVAAGLSGKGPAFAAVARSADAKAVEAAMTEEAGENAAILSTRFQNQRAGGLE